MQKQWQSNGIFKAIEQWQQQTKELMRADISQQIINTQKPLIECPECGQKIKTKISFNGRAHFRNKRKTQYCNYCGWSKIIPTEREAMIEIGLID